MGNIGEHGEESEGRLRRRTACGGEKWSRRDYTGVSVSYSAEYMYRVQYWVIVPYSLANMWHSLCLPVCVWVAETGGSGGLYRIICGSNSQWGGVEAYLVRVVWHLCPRCICSTVREPACSIAFNNISNGNLI